MSTAATILVVIFVFVIIKHGMESKARQERERLRLIEEALRNDQLDDRSREELMAVLAGRKPSPSQPPPTPPPRPRNPHDVGFLLKFLAFLGWLGLCTGISFFIIDSLSRGYDYLLIPGTILSCAGFGLVTFPFVIRELNSPRRGETVERRT